MASLEYNLLIQLSYTSAKMADSFAKVMVFLAPDFVSEPYYIMISSSLCHHLFCALGTEYESFVSPSQSREFLQSNKYESKLKV